jgi:predicted phosphodiesterase
MSRVLVVSDLHNPATHPGALTFCCDLYEKYNCNKVVFIGDIVDHQAISFHANNPECPGSKDEYQLAFNCIRPWLKVFPKAVVTIGNHDRRVLRLAESVNIPKVYLRDFADIWQTPGWMWVKDTVIDEVYYFHGEGRSGIHPAWNAMKDYLMPVVMGHCHSASGVKWSANPNKRTFGLDTGCLIDIDAFQFTYGKHMRSRPMLSAAIVLDGIPQHIIMPCGRGEKYYKARFSKKEKENGKISSE